MVKVKGGFILVCFIFVVGIGFFYVKLKNFWKFIIKFEMCKYDFVVNKYVFFIEVKMK